MAYRLNYSIDHLEGMVSGDLPSVMQDFTALIEHRLPSLDPNWRSAKPPSVRELRQLITTSDPGIRFDLSYG